MLLTKIIVTVLVILLLAAVAEYGSPRLAGTLSGYPIGSAVVLYFYGLERGVEFAAAAAIYNLTGMIPTLAFASGYLHALRRTPLCTPVVPTIMACCCYLTSSLLLGVFDYSRFAATGLAAVAIIGAGVFARSTGATASPGRLSFSPWLLLVRGVAAAALVVLITSLAGRLGAQWAGMLSAFPLVLYPLILMLHLNSGAARVRALLSCFPHGLWSVLAYSLTLSYCYPVLGLGLGTLAGFAVATIGLLLLHYREILGLRRNVQLPLP